MPVATPGVAQGSKTIVCDGISSGTTRLSTVSVNGMPSYSTLAWVVPLRASYVLQPNTGNPADGVTFITSSDGSRQWVAAPAVHYREDLYETSSTWTSPNPLGPGFADVDIVGLGGAGGGGASTQPGNPGGGPGGPGGVSQQRFPLAALGVSVAVTVPAAVAGVLYNGGPGGVGTPATGADVTFGSFLRATAGAGGPGAALDLPNGSPGAGGFGTFGQSPQGVGTLHASIGGTGAPSPCGVFPGAGAGGGANADSPGVGIIGRTGGAGVAGSTAASSNGVPGGIGATAIAAALAGFNASAGGGLLGGGGGGGGTAGDVPANVQGGAAGGKYGGGGGGTGAWGGGGIGVFSAFSGNGGPGVVRVRSTWWS